MKWIWNKNQKYHLEFYNSLLVNPQWLREKKNFQKCVTSQNKMSNQKKFTTKKKSQKGSEKCLYLCQFYFLKQMSLLPYAKVQGLCVYQLSFSLFFFFLFLNSKNVSFFTAELPFCFFSTSIYIYIYISSVRLLFFHCTFLYCFFLCLFSKMKQLFFSFFFTLINNFYINIFFFRTIAHSLFISLYICRPLLLNFLHL